MAKQNDSIQQFTALRTALATERDTIQKRLQQINAALGGGPSLKGTATAPAPMRTPPAKRQKRSSKLAPPRSDNEMSIREAITKATSKHPLSIREIVDAVQKLGYKFKSTNPVNSVGAYLYGAHGKKHFKRKDGKFSAI